MVMKYYSAALDGLCTQEQLDLLNSIDTLRSQGISHFVSLPQIIVCGDQSSGKSSVLEAISGVSFPVRSNLCTRFPTELVLRKDPTVGVRVSIVPHHSRSEAEQKSLSTFCEELDGFDGLSQLVENAKAAMGISTHGKAFSNDILRVEISGPDRPHLTIVDLPGLIHSETKQQSAADVQLVQSVVQMYMKEPRSIILAVVSAKNDYANQIVLRLARDADDSGQRTLGVITKPDTLVMGSESERMFISLAKNEDVKFRLGWHALRNMDSDQGTSSLADRDSVEREFFANGAWGEMPPSLVGIDSLRIRLSKLLLRQIAAELPSLIEEIQIKKDNCRQQLENLGQPRVTLDEQKSYLLNISQSYQRLVKAAVDGTYNETFFSAVHSTTGRQKRMRAVIQNLNEEFAECLMRRGHRREIIEKEAEKKAEKGQLLITRDTYMLHIQGLIKQTRGRELPGTFNPMIVNELFLEQCAPWKDITLDHVLNTWEAAQVFLLDVIRYISDEATSVVLFDELISPELDELRRNLEKRTRELLAPHHKGHPITYNHYFTETLQSIRASRQRARLSSTMRNFFGVDDLSGSYVLNGSYRLDDLLQSLVSLTEPDMTRLASAEALDCMLAYYKVALKRFIDDVAVEVIELNLVQSLSSILSPVKVFEMPSELVTRIAGESKENRALRDQLNRKLQVLAKGLETCRQFVGSQSINPDKSGMSKVFSSFHRTPPDSVISVDNGDELECDVDDSCSERSTISAPPPVSPGYEEADARPVSRLELLVDEPAEFDAITPPALYHY
ncbi:Dynamin family protein [Aspergillus clavatus NRRL 1]|uniref:Dynamin family protein n=1 Tax=Aspergillus clavatus (strain ATCC 1007 / CBS 513.65 / DSM 816 / NCTC 3887 / NRRL 1 / QM 1276 / 107) TaxID=344612 RepID=A1CDG8_ASPCL|nr:Dynamin family protein [Aspergillus clavatus NRRL 1]EAW11895.1 Dynamin family protein [Aspergillus clavatus NRRL 1]